MALSQQAFSHVLDVSVSQMVVCKEGSGCD